MIKNGLHRAYKSVRDVAVDHAQLLSVTDVQTLRALVVRKLQIIADCEQAIAACDLVIARHERTITERDANIA